MELTKHWAGQLDDYVIDLAWSPDGACLAAASAAGPVGIFAAADGARLHELPGHDQGTNALSWRPVGGTAPLLATGGQDGAVKIWDAGAGQHVATARLGPGWVEHLQWGSVLAAASGRKAAILEADGTVRAALPDAPKTVTALALHPRALAVGCFGGVRLFDPSTGGASKELPYANGIQALVWSPDGRWLVSGNQDPSVHLWIPSQDAEFHMSGYEGKVKVLDFDRSSRWLATSGGRDACIWDCSGAGPEGRAPSMFPHDAPVTAVAFQRLHGLLATASQDGVVQLWSPERKQPLRATVRMKGAATRIAWSADDTMLAIGGDQGAVYVLRCEA
jgi:WD40 repeat protein